MSDLSGAPAGCGLQQGFSNSVVGGSLESAHGMGLKGLKIIILQQQPI